MQRFIMGIVKIIITQRIVLGIVIANTSIIVTIIITQRIVLGIIIVNIAIAAILIVTVPSITLGIMTYGIVAGIITIIGSISPCPRQGLRLGPTVIDTR